MGIFVPLSKAVGHDKSSRTEWGCVVALGLLATSLISGMTLGGINASAEESGASSTASVNVASACNFTSTTPEPHEANIKNGTSEENIGQTILKAHCNDSGGFSIYAIGYTDEEYGKTVLSSQTVGDSKDIATGTSMGGASSWAMKLDNSLSTSYPITLDNDFNNYSAVPGESTRVAYRESGTDAGAEATGATLSATYRVYISPDQPADTYVGKVRYTMVHPSSEKPNQPVVTAANKISYNPNANGIVDSMGDQGITASSTSATLWANNFQRPGYGFAGWNDRFDMSGTNYGPNEDISFTAGQYSAANGGLSLYANWVKSKGTMQNWTGCSSLEQGTVTALTDRRDGNTYAIAKLADGKCWMIENLRLADKSTVNVGTNATLTRTNTNNPLSVDGTVALKDADGNTIDHLPVSINPATNAWCNDKNATCIDQSLLYNDNTASVSSNMTGINTNAYGYGNYYNWYSATAGNGTYSFGTSNSSVSGDLCPAGWHLPTGGQTTVNTTADFYTLGKALMKDSTGTSIEPNQDASDGYGYYDSTPTNANGDTATKAFRKYPNNFLYSGRIYRTLGYRGSDGRYWASTTYDGIAAYGLRLTSSEVNPGTSNYDKYDGFGVRCLVGS